MSCEVQKLSDCPDDWNVQHSGFCGSPAQSAPLWHRRAVDVPGHVKAIELLHVATQLDDAVTTGQFGTVPGPVVTVPQQTWPGHSSGPSHVTGGTPFGQLAMHCPVTPP